MSPIAIALLVAAGALVVAAEWGTLFGRFGSGARRSRKRNVQKSKLRVISTSAPVRSESEEFARSVERDLAALPTIDERDAKRR